MQLSLPPENKKKLQQIQQQKKRLKDRIQKISETQNKSEKDTTSSYEENMAILLQRKKRLEEEKQKQFHLKKMQDQYIQRRKQMEREKRMEQLQNQKRMIQLEVGIKRMVFEGTKQKVKGMNSQQLMMRAMLRDGHEEPHKKPYSSKGNVRRDFQQFLEAEHRHQYKYKWDIYELNEKRFQVFEKKEQALMRQVLLKQLISKQKDEEINVLKMNKKQLEDMLEALGIDVYDYVQVTPKEAIIQALPQIERQARERIQQYSKQAEQQKLQNQKLQKQKGKLKQFLLLRPADTVRISRSIIYDIINSIVMDYEKRLNRYKVSQFERVKKQMESRYQTVLLQSQDYEYSKVITLKLLQKVHKQFYEEAAEEIAKLHNWAHDRTQECFQWMFARGTNITKKLNDVAAIDFELNFEDDGGEDYEPRKHNTNLKKQDYLRKFQDYQPNIFDVDKLTTQLINQINLLEVQASYFKNISIKVHGQREGPDQTFHILYDRQFYAITNAAVHNAKKIKVKLQKLGIKSGLKMLAWQKFHNFWLIHDQEKVSMYSPWGLQVLPNEIGQRVGNTCGKIIATQIFPIYTVIGMTCSIMLGFEKGQVLKYNLNMNRIDNSQTNLSLYFPILPQIKRQQQPPFPLEKKNLIKYEAKKITQNVQIHQFRQFFDHHTTAIIGINFYKHNSFITVDRNFKCAIWFYDYKEGAKCYKPAYQFQFVCSYLVYQEANDTKFRNVYPGDRANESPQQMFQKWMQTQGFLKKQVYNNPKKNTAYFRATEEAEQKGQVPLLIVTYNASEAKVLKIHESYFSASPGKMEAKSSKIWRKYLMILGERDHAMRNDLKTIKIYGWDIEERKMRSIGIQFDVYKNQTQTQFEILDNMLVGVDVQLMAVVSSGRILIFSLISGQLLRNISDSQYLQQPKYASYYFTEITARRSLLGAATKSHTMQISLNDHNNHEQQRELNKLIDDVARKYINLV